MKIRTIGRHFRDAFKSLFRNGLMTFGAISAVSMVLFLVGAFTAILFNVNKLATDIENDVNVRVYIDLAANQTQVDQLEAQILQLDQVTGVEFRSKDQELEDITKSFSEDFALFKEDGNPLRDAFDVSTSSPEATKAVATQIEQLDYVAKVNYGGARADKLFKLIATTRWIGGLIIGGLMIISILLISNTIRSTIYARRYEIEIMKLVGAKDSYIRWPFFLEGAFIGLIGSILPLALLWFVYLALYQGGNNFLAGTNFGLLAPNPFLTYLSLILAGIGILIGAFGSLFSIRRFLRI